MNTFAKGRGAELIFSVIVLLILSVIPCYALRPEEEVTQSQPAALAQQQVLPIRLPSDTQLQLAKEAEPFGVTVEWDSSLGTPSSIRGPDLGQRQAFSGGKGLALKGAGFYEQDAIAVLDNLAGFFLVQDAETEFESQTLEQDALGFHHVRLAQVYKGLRVIGGQVIVHFNNKEESYEVNGNYVPGIDADITARITPTEAVTLAQDDLTGSGKPEGSLTQDPELVIFAFQAEPALAYELTLSYDHPDGPGRWRYWIDANEGTVLLRFNDIKIISAPTTNGVHTSITGIILSGEGGSSATVTGWLENAYYYLYNTNRHWYIYNIASSGYTDNNTYAYRTNSSWSTSDVSEVSAAYNFNAVQKYYYRIHERGSFNNSNAYARANVHQGTNYVNAYWDGTDFHFGDGDGSEANSLAVLDVCGHEFTHAVTEYSADLLYYGEPGALNESFSDIFGACAEFYAQPDGSDLYPSVTNGYADWLMGEDCWLDGTALRDMRNPGSTVTLASGYQQPSRYHGSDWYYGSSDNAGVHYNGGPQSFFFYLLCEGGSGINDGISYSVTGIAVTNAEKIAYRALTVYCTKYTDYWDVRSAWVSAALDLNTNWLSSVTQAWAAVGATDTTSTSLGEAVDAPSLTWYTGGATNWFSETTTTHDGIDAAQSGDIGSAEQSRMYTTVSGPGSLSFWWKVSSETNYDFLRFYIDETEQTNISGSVDWQNLSFAIPIGDHTLCWKYTKDELVSSGSDAGWLDQVTWTFDLTISASDGTYVDKIAITWGSIGSPEYEIWRAQYPQTDFSQASLLATNSSTNYNDTSVSAGILYYYWVNATFSGVTSILSNADSGWRSWLPAVPTGVSATDGTYTDKVCVTWSAATNASTYAVYRNASNDTASAEWQCDGTGTEHNDTTAVAGTTYYYWVRGRNDRDNLSDFSTADTGWRASEPEPEPPSPQPPSDPVPDAPSWASASDGAYTDKVRVTWASSTYSTSYQVWRNTVNDSASATLLTTVTATGYDDTAVVLNAIYYYWVRAKNAGGESGFSPGDSGYSSSAPAADLRATDFQLLPDVIRVRASPELVSVCVANDGPNSMSGSNAWISLAVFLSTNDTLGDTDDISVGSVLKSTPMTAGQSTNLTLSASDLAQLQVPSSVATGFYSVFLSVDHTLLSDLIETNNIVRLTDPIEVTAPAGMVRNDFDGDAKTDLAVYHAASGYWYILLSGSATLSYQKLGESGYSPVPGDFDGDEKTDLAVYHEASGYWYIVLSSTGALSYQKLGETGYMPVSGDFNGDWKTDLAVYHQASGYWYILLSGSSSLSYQKLGETGYTPVAGDFDGDGITDLAVYHESSGYWYVLLSSTGALSYQKFGETGYIPVSGDFDGDAKTDLAVYHEASGYWYILLSGSSSLSYQKFGEPGYESVPGDFDGDGKADLAVYHEESGYWFVMLSSTYELSWQKFGESGYSPVW